MKKFFYIFNIVLYCSLQCYSFQISGENKFLNFSDVHFDPFYDTTLVDELIRSKYEAWETVFAGSSTETLSGYGSDSNFPLLISALRNMQSMIPNPDFIIITGDFMSHNFNENFTTYSGTNNIDSLHAFIEKTMRFITAMIVKHYPSTTIFPAIGNDDAFCGNYMVDPDGAFLKMVSEAWTPLVNKNVKNTSFQRNFSKGGYVVLNIPETDNYKLIILNTIFFSTKYINECGDKSIDPGKQELDWLRKKLKQCKKNNWKVWMAYHIPPGIDIYGTITGEGSCENKIVTSWKDIYNEEFLKIMNDYSSIINSSFAGHFHRDDFRIITKQNIPVSYIHLTPSISPIYGNNPAYQIITYNKLNFDLINYETYYLNNISGNGSSSWEFEYNFQKSFEQRALTVSSLNNIYNLIQSDSTIRSIYINNYTAGNSGAFVKDYNNWFYNWCGFLNLTKESYAKCLCKDSSSYMR